jgi:putative ABC transport system substrate-binding protein
VVALPLAARAQDPERMRFIGVLMPYAESETGGATNLSALRQGLQQLGWMEGRNVRFEHRWPTPDAHSMGKLAKELVDLRP